VNDLLALSVSVLHAKADAWDALAVAISNQAITGSVDEGKANVAIGRASGYQDCARELRALANRGGAV
jgi:hypothetical protein